jgi:PBP1b-binding outer membrane lipoprotein LpoB
MRAIKKQFKSVALILSMIILLQGCTAYKSVSISLEQAVQNESKVRVKTKSNERLKFKRIGKDEGQFYGVKKEKGEMTRIPLDSKFIDSIKEKDKTLSTILTIALPIAIIVGAGFIFQDAFKWKNTNTPLFPPGFFKTSI